MENYISLKTLKNAELLLRLTMVVTLLVAGISKFCSKERFYHYYLKQFSNQDLRLRLPTPLFDTYLRLIPFIEVAIAMALIASVKRRLFIVIWILYFISLEIGHYILEEFNSVDLIIPIILSGVIAYLLPGYDLLTKTNLTQSKNE